MHKYYWKYTEQLYGDKRNIYLVISLKPGHVVLKLQYKDQRIQGIILLKFPCVYVYVSFASVNL